MAYRYIGDEPAPTPQSKPYYFYRCLNCRALFVQRDQWEPPKVCARCHQ